MAYLEAEDARHALRVLRLDVGAQVQLFADGQAYAANICQTGPDGVAVRVLEKLKSPEASLRVTLYQGVPKGDKMDYIVQKCTEAGASEIYFFASSRCVARIQGDADKKIARWQRIAEEAAKQSGRGVIPAVGFLPDLAEAFNKANATALPLFMYETGERETLREAVESAGNIASAAILTGPEGGFEPFEAELARIMKLHICSMGPRIFRCETAPVAALSALMYATGNM